jgi:hypothetical protein
VDPNRPWQIPQSRVDICSMEERRMATKEGSFEIVDCDKINDHTSLRGQKVLER